MAGSNRPRCQKEHRVLPRRSPSAVVSRKTLSPGQWCFQLFMRTTIIACLARDDRRVFSPRFHDRPPPTQRASPRRLTGQRHLGIRGARCRGHTTGDGAGGILRIRAGRGLPRHRLEGEIGGGEIATARAWSARFTPPERRRAPSHAFI